MAKPEVTINDTLCAFLKRAKLDDPEIKELTIGVFQVARLIEERNQWLQANLGKKNTVRLVDIRSGNNPDKKEIIISLDFAFKAAVEENPSEYLQLSPAERKKRVGEITLSLVDVTFEAPTHLTYYDPLQIGFNKLAPKTGIPDEGAEDYFAEQIANNKSKVRYTSKHAFEMVVGLYLNTVISRITAPRGLTQGYN